MDKATKEIRDAFKALGWNNRKVSVKHRYCGYSDAIDITIKSFDIDVKKAEDIAKSKQSIRYDEATGEILMGANTFVNVRFDNELLENEKNDIRYINIANKMRNMKMKPNCGEIIAENDKFIIYYFKNIEYVTYGQIYIESKDNSYLYHHKRNYKVYHEDSLEGILVDIIRCRKLIDIEDVKYL
jgi:hypothetical protein